MINSKFIGLVAATCAFAVAEPVQAQYGSGNRPGNHRRVDSVVLDRIIKHSLRDSPVNINVIRDRGNGVNQRVVAPSTPKNKRININLIRNSGNGVGNEVIAGGVRGGYNVNVLENSANGSRNDVRLRGRGNIRNGININVIRDSVNGDGNRLRTGYRR